MSKRRSRGEGTIYQRPDGLWAAQITLPNGKRKTKYGKSQRVVRDWLIEQQNATRQGTWTDTGEVTVSVFMERYLADVVAHTLRPKTQESYTLLTRTHILPELGNIRLPSLRPNHLQSLYAEKLNQGYSRRTVQYIHSIIHKALSQAVRWGLVPRNVADAVDAPRPAKKPPEMLTEAQAKAFLESVKDHHLYPLYVTAMTTGMRKAEILGLRWSSVDLNQGIIQVSQVAMTVHQKGTILAEPKTEKSRRSIEVPALTVAALQAHRERQDRLRAEASKWTDNDLVFPTKRGTAIGSRNLLKYFHDSLEKAGVPKVRFHSLRHLHSTLLLTAGVHPKIVQERLGHSRIDITMDTYSHVIPGLGKVAAETMESVFTTA